MLTWRLIDLTPVLAVGPQQTSPQIKVNGVYFQVEIAGTEAEWRKGLMFREKMSSHQGMLFVGKSERRQSFWMKNTLIPLDIIFISADKKIISIAKNTKPLSEDPIPSAKPAQYVLEIRAGQATVAKMKAGDAVEFLNIKGI